MDGVLPLYYKPFIFNGVKMPRYTPRSVLSLSKDCYWGNTTLLWARCECLSFEILMKTDRVLPLPALGGT